MDARTRWTVPAAGVVLVLLAIGAGGCTSPRATMGFDQSLAASVEALQAGDLTEADLHIERAAGQAQTYEQRRQVQGLQRLSAGAQAMMQGQADQASRQWAAIEDPRLNRQVRRQAQESLSLEVPMLAATEEATP